MRGARPLRSLFDTISDVPHDTVIQVFRTFLVPRRVFTCLRIRGKAGLDYASFVHFLGTTLKMVV